MRRKAFIDPGFGIVTPCQNGAPPFCENKSLYRVICLEHIKKEQAIREAVFSAQMEGLRVTAETERRIRKILDGELTVEERVQQLKSNARKRTC